MIYLDYSANTPAEEEVLEAFLRTERDCIGNPNALHPAGAAAREKLAEITDSVAAALGAEAGEVVYVSGASEANNTAVKGVARALRHRGKHILTTALEHPSVSAPLTWLQEQGYEIELVKIGRDGKIDLEDLRSLLREDTVLVAVSAVDSELGVPQPIREIGEILKDYPNCRLHVDATQAIGKLPFSPEGIDTISLSAHKFYGLNGSGLLVRRGDAPLEPLVHGGSGSSLYRSGTPTLALAAALDEALRLALPPLQERYDYVKGLNETLRSALAKTPGVRINSPAGAVPHILNLSVDGIRGTRFQQALAEKGVCVSVKSACSTDGTPSRAVYAVSRDRKNALSSWRISLSHKTSEAELREFLSIFEQCRRELAG